jgi:long-chain acyl-CoA synthetase
MRLSNDAIVAAWAEVLDRRSGDAAIYDTQATVIATFADVERRAREIEASDLAQFRVGEVVAIQAGNHPDWPALLLACLRRRVVVLPLEGTMSDDERETALRICRAAALVTTADAHTRFTTLGAVGGIDSDGAQPSLLKLTSGTTAAPRAIKFTSDQLLADCTQICDTMGITDADINFAVIPISHSYGFSNVLTPLIARGVPVVISRDRMPRAVLGDLARTNATVFPGMPIFFQALANFDQVPSLPNLRLCISAGAPLRAEVAARFREKFGIGIHSFYGSSECGGICYDRESKAHPDGFVGRPMNGVQVELMEPDAPVSRITVRTAAAGLGYFPEPDDAKLSAGMFRPDDLIDATADGLRIVGRVSDVINVAGKKVNPAEVEAHLLRYDGVQQAVVFGRESPLRNQEVAACVVAAASVREDALLEFCRRRLSGWQVPKRIFFVQEIPVNERGKTSRRDLAAQFAA